MITTATSSASSTAGLEPFVYADVAVERNGMELSVLSALSRQGLDPWQEAQRLAQLPRRAAADRLAQTLRTLPAVQSLRMDVRMIAERLVALLPAQPVVAAGHFASKLNAPKLNATSVQVPRGLTLVMMAMLFGSLLVPLLMPKPAAPVAPASWVTDGSKTPVKPQPIPGQTAPSPQPDHPDATATAKPPRSAH